MSKVKNTNLKTLSNGIELASKIIENISGNEIANTVNGEIMSGKEIQRAVAAKMQSVLMSNKGKYK